MKERIGVIGLGYVGLPVALAFARKFPDTVGFDIDRERVDELRRGIDRNREQPADVLRATKLGMTSDAGDLVRLHLLRRRRPDAGRRATTSRISTPVERASETVGRVMAKGAVVVYESTVYPGRHRGGVRPDPRARQRLEARASISSSATHPSASTRATRSTRSRRSPRSSAARTPRRSTASPTLTAPSSTPACIAPRASRSPRQRRSSRTRSAISTSP